ncbi:MAG: MAPEG family protein [Gammaproteobacteria bacterium]
MIWTHPLVPATAMVALTAVVWVRLFIERIAEMRARRIPAQGLATSHQSDALLRNTLAADNFKNLFEIPVLFYVLCVALAITPTQTAFSGVGLWLFVVLRAAHSLIHCSYNNVMHRFTVYLLSTVLLFAMWVEFGLALATSAA